MPAETPAVPHLPATWSLADTLGAWRVRWGINRYQYRVDPGLYALGDPGQDSPVLVTGNYKLSVDIVRRDMAGRDAWLMVVDTRGINVWCAAGKGTFSSAEVAKRAITSGLVDHVAHETLVLPQLSATGVAAHEVRKMSGYRVVFGPADSRDLPAFLDAGMKATPEMRGVRFPFAARIVLAPVELVGAWRHAWAILVYMLLAAVGASIATRTFAWQWGLLALFPSVLGFFLATFAGGVVVPALLPWIPGRAFSVKGAVAGATLALLALAALPGMLGIQSAWGWAAVTLGVSAYASYVGLNFTGSSTYTSPSGVERELRAALPWQAAALIASLVTWTVAVAIRIGGLS